MVGQTNTAPLAGVVVVEWTEGVAGAYAGRLLSTLGAEVVFVEPPEGAKLRSEPPLLPKGAGSALFAYLCAGKQSVAVDWETAAGKASLARLLSRADIFIHDMPAELRVHFEADEASLRRRYPKLIDASVLPFGGFGPKSWWRGEELNLLHASGEGFLLPNGLSAELFPDRPPLKIHGHFAELQGGVVAALGALCALVAREAQGAQSVDVSVQDAALAVGAFALQRYGDGSLEHRRTRSFKYGGVLECADGYVELLTLEERQWAALVELMDSPDWAREPALADPLERSRRGDEINARIRAWARLQRTADIVARAQAVGAPMAKYRSPAEILAGEHERARQLFQSVEIAGVGARPVLVAPYQFDGMPLALRGGPPTIGQHQSLVEAAELQI